MASVPESALLAFVLAGRRGARLAGTVGLVVGAAVGDDRALRDALGRRDRLRIGRGRAVRGAGVAQGAARAVPSSVMRRTKTRLVPVGAMFAFLPVKSTEGRSSCVSGEAAPGADAGSLGDAWQLIGDAVAGMNCTWQFRSRSAPC